MAQLQEATTVEEGQEAKYLVGARLRFVGYSEEEIAPCKTFKVGDIVRVDPVNGCGMGIDVTRLSDGARDMVWPEEVEVV